MTRNSSEEFRKRPAPRLFFLCRFFVYVHGLCTHDWTWIVMTINILQVVFINNIIRYRFRISLVICGTFGIIRKCSHTYVPTSFEYRYTHPALKRIYRYYGITTQASPCVFRRTSGDHINCDSARRFSNKLHF